jgi:hypothetical protein
MGSTMCKGGSLQEVLQFNQIKLPKPQRLDTNDYTMLQSLQELQDIQRSNTRYTRYEQEI